MSKIYEGNSWKHCDDQQKPQPIPTRAEFQERIDTDYALGLISLSEWRRLTDELNAPTLAAQEDAQ